jgi:Hint domain
MVSRDRFERGIDPTLFAKPDLRTSRRNFIAAASTVAAAGVLWAGLGARPARAHPDNNGSDQGCAQSGGVPPKCESSFSGPSGPSGPSTNCFLSGTRIATPDGEVEIDDLRIGDRVVTVSGDPKLIKWIGRNHFRRSPSQSWKSEIAPVKLARFSLDDQTPHRDLYLSPAHAIYLHGLLIPAIHLINGRSIIARQHEDRLTLDYYHIELEDHDVVIAEGAPAETFAGCDHSGFDNAAEYQMLYGTSLAPQRSFAPVVALNGGRQELRSRLRSTISPIYDVRRPFEIIRDHVDARAFRIAA